MPFFGGSGKYKFIGSNVDGDDGSAYADLTSGTNNVAIGTNNLADVTTGSVNIAIGDGNMPVLTTGRENIGIGSRALQEASTGNDNVALGYQSLQSLTTGTGNIGIGASSGVGIRTGADNIAIGSALSGINDFVTGNYNIAIGLSAGDVVTTGSENILIGISAADSLETGGFNVVIGSYAGSGLQTGANVVIGAEAATGLSAIAENLLVIGNQALFNQAVTAGHQNLAIVGNNSFNDPGGIFTITGSNSIVFGNNSLGPIGALTAARTVSDFIGIGNNIQITNDTSASNRIVIGNDITSSVDNKITIGDASHDSIEIAGIDFSAGPGAPAVSGTFNPVLVSTGGGAPTYNQRAASYQTVGNRLTFNERIWLTDHGTLAAGDLTLTGLPTAAVNTTGLNNLLEFKLINGAALGPDQFVAQIVAGSSTITLFKISGTTVVPLTRADIGPDAVFLISGSYPIA